MKVIDKRNYKNPKVSVIMSVYNDSEFLEKSIKSILNQKFKNFEFIILNDGSTDNSEKIIKKYLKKSKKILYIYSKHNKGLAFMLNLGIKHVRANYIIRHDADDYSLINRIKNQYTFMEKNKDISVLGSNSKDIFNKKKKFKITSMPTKSTMIEKNLIKSNCLIHASLIIRKKFLTKVGLYNTKFLRCQDYELWLRGRNKYKYANLKDVMIIRNVNKKKFKFIDLYLAFKARLMHSHNFKDILNTIIFTFRDLIKKILNFFI